MLGTAIGSRAAVVAQGASPATLARVVVFRLAAKPAAAIERRLGPALVRTMLLTSSGTAYRIQLPSHEPAFLKQTPLGDSSPRRLPFSSFSRPRHHRDRERPFSLRSTSSRSWLEPMIHHRGSGLRVFSPPRALPLRRGCGGAQGGAALSGAARPVTSAACGQESSSGGSVGLAGNERRRLQEGERGGAQGGAQRGEQQQPGRQVGASTELSRQWRRLCYYHTQGKCGLSEDKDHTKKFSHDLPDLSMRAGQLKKVRKQAFDYFLVLDLEGRVEILEFPVVLLCARSLRVVSHFHRFVRPDLMTQERQAEYIGGKYGPWGLARVWHDTAIPFAQVLAEFEQWLEQHNLLDHSSSATTTWNEESALEAGDTTEEGVWEEEKWEEGREEQGIGREEKDSRGDEFSNAVAVSASPPAVAAQTLGHGPGLRSAIVVTCGNWDVKSKIVEQCRDSQVPLPTYFLQWTNLKDVYLNFYKRKASGMMPMMKGLQMAPLGTHHVGLDDALNITRVLQRMLSHGALIRASARRVGPGPADVEYAFKRRVK
ncbi:unnamed protein product [Closterium sp. Yama58-4]|nr:unnamed protein product [Closterium sp. Yama58-4]